MNTFAIFARCAVLAALVGAVAMRADAATPPEKLRVPKGFTIELLTDAVPNARAMALGRVDGDRATVYVGSYGEGKVYAVEIEQGRAKRVHTIASGLQLPIGVAYRDGQLFVSAVSRILRFDAIDTKLQAPPTPVIVNDRLPPETHHGAKFIGFGPDGWLYVAVGAPCNVCAVDPAHGLIERMRPDGSGREVVARGVRNSVGFDWSPVDKALWFTDNGRDQLGDDLPSDELNRVAPSAGSTPLHFGFPYCHQGDTPDPQFGTRRACSEFVAPAAKLGAHVASLGMRFATGRQFPPEYLGGIFIAEHGSWNRSRKSGYRVVYATLDARGKVTKQEPFVEGWLVGETNSGRPVDVLVLPDGSLLISEDSPGAIYRVRYSP